MEIISLSRVMGITRTDRVRIIAIREQLKLESILDSVDKSQLVWFGFINMEMWVISKHNAHFLRASVVMNYKYEYFIAFYAKKLLLSHHDTTHLFD